jgi:hypothetical protein
VSPASITTKRTTALFTPFILALMSFAPPSHRDDFKIAIICVLKTEYNAVALVFDVFKNKKQNQYGKAEEDPNYHTTGRVENCNIILALLSHMGKVHAASAAASCQEKRCFLSEGRDRYDAGSQCGFVRRS